METKKQKKACPRTTMDARACSKSKGLGSKDLSGNKRLDSKDVECGTHESMKHLQKRELKQEEQVGGINGSIKCFQSSWLRRDGENIYISVLMM